MHSSPRARRCSVIAAAGISYLDALLLASARCRTLPTRLPNRQRSATDSLQARTGLADDAEVHILLHVDRRFEKAQVDHLVDIVLQNRGLENPIGVPVEVVLGEQPGIELLRRQLGDARDNIDDLTMIGRVRIEAT